MMELSQLVREIESTPDPTARARIERSRAAVLQAIATLPSTRARSRSRSRSRWVWGGTTAVGTLTAGAVIAAVVIAGTVSPLAAQPASAAAIAVLDGAASLVITGVDPVVAPGQYLKIRETYEVVSLWDKDCDPNRVDCKTAAPEPTDGFNTSSLPTSEGAIRAQGVRDLYVPSNRSDGWILDDRFTNEALNVYGAPEALPAYERMVAAFPERDADPGGIESLPAGLMTWSPDTADDDQYWDPFRDDYADMPRDPQKLLTWYEKHLSSSDDWYIFQAIGRYLSTDVMPADLRASSLRVLGLLSGVDVAGTTGSVTTLELPTKLGKGGPFGDLLVSQLDVDTSTGRIIGSRELYPARSTELLPAGLPWASWRIDVTVVDEAPAL